MPLVEPRIPWQNDSYNCGVYVLMFIYKMHKMLLRGLIKFNKSSIDDKGIMWTRKIFTFKNPEDIEKLRRDYKSELERRVKSQEDCQTHVFNKIRNWE